jgi:hypothetical protein
MKANVQIACVFDTTGSMTPVSKEVRRNNCQLIKSAFSTIPALEMGMIAVGDDLPTQGRGGYLTKVLNLQRDWDKVANFVTNVEPACGGDFDECYELALNQLRSFPWVDGAKKAVLFFGDARPHSVNHPKNKGHFNWETEARALAAQGVSIHAIHCLAHYGERGFWQKLAKIGNGIYFQLDQWSHVESLVLGITHHISGGVDSLSRYQADLQRKGAIPVGVQRSFDAITGRKTTRKRTDGRTPIVDGSRFQVITCDAIERQDVQDFAVAQGLIAEKSQFNSVIKGHLYYAHTERTETLRPNHEVVIQDNRSDEMFAGDEAREWLGCLFGETCSLKANPLGAGYTVWLQSKSVNRKMFPGQKVMVEMTKEIKHAMEDAEVLV